MGIRFCVPLADSNKSSHSSHKFPCDYNSLPQSQNSLHLSGLSLVRASSLIIDGNFFFQTSFQSFSELSKSSQKAFDSLLVSFWSAFGRFFRKFSGFRFAFGALSEKLLAWLLVGFCSLLIASGRLDASRKLSEKFKSILVNFKVRA